MLKPLKISILVLFLQPFYWSASAQIFSIDTAYLTDKDPPLHVFKSNPLAMIWSQIPLTGELRLLYETVHSPKRTSVFGLSYIYLSPLLRDSYDSLLQNLPFEPKINGFRIQGAVKHYILGTWLAPYGFYMGLHSSFNTVKIYIPKNSPYRSLYNNYYAKITFINASVIGGLQIILFKTIALDVYGGLGYRYNFVQEFEYPNIKSRKFDTETGVPQWLKISFSTNIGIAF
ncbi:MAG: hypothetical protein IH946_07230 [Bacteroidetes bacterium]|nr:hypothetical protein [Bacteroidota bacterium]